MATDRQEDVRARAVEPFGLGARGARQALEQRAVHHARAAGRHRSQRAGQGAVIGSGPFRFVQGGVAAGQPGRLRPQRRLRAAQREPQRRRRRQARAASTAWSGAYIPDSATAGAALEAGEIDYWEILPADFVARLEKNPNISVFVTDPTGSQGWLRPNHLHPPFNNKKARQALLLDGRPGDLPAGGHRPAEVLQGLPARTSCAAACPTRRRPARRASRTSSARASSCKESGYDGRPIVRPRSHRHARRCTAPRWSPRQLLRRSARRWICRPRTGPPSSPAGPRRTRRPAAAGT